MTLEVIKFFGLLAIFAMVLLVIQPFVNFLLTQRLARHEVNRRLRLINKGVSREDIAGLIRADYGQGELQRGTLQGRFYRMVGQAAIGVAPRRLIYGIGIAVLLTFVVILLASRSVGTALGPGTLLLLFTFSFALAAVLPILAINRRAQRRSKRLEEQFPDAVDTFTRALRAGHPVASAISLLTTETEDPLGSEFGLVADEIAYGSDLNSSLRALADRWDSEDLKMFAVCVSVQSETGGNLAEILSNLSGVIRERATLYLKVRALSSEGRMSAWMLTLLPLLTFLVLFSINPGFYLDVAQDPLFISCFVTLLVLYLLGIVWIRKMVDLKV